MSEARDAAIAATQDYEEPIDEEYFESLGCDDDPDAIQNYDSEEKSIIDPLDLGDHSTSHWSSDLSSIPFDTEVVVAWNFTNSMSTKSIMIRSSDTPAILGLDDQMSFIMLRDAKYWLALPDLPE